MRFFYFLILIILAFTTGYYSKKFNIPASFHSWLKNSNTKIDHTKVKHIFSKDYIDFDLLTEEVRLFVNTNSIRRDKKDNFNENDSNKTLEMMINFYSKKGPPPALSCSARALVMQRILQILDYKSRIVNLFSENSGSHTLLEILNPKTKKWILEDPDYNISYKFLGKEEKISLADVIIHSVDKYIPCREKECQWSFADNLKVYSGAALYFNFDHSPIILINQKKIKANAVLKWDNKKRDIATYVNDIWGQNITNAVSIIFN